LRLSSQRWLCGTSEAAAFGANRLGRRGFAAGSKLNKIAVDGGAVVPLTDLAGPFGGASWGEDGIIVAQQGKGLARIPGCRWSRRLNCGWIM